MTNSVLILVVILFFPFGQLFAQPSKDEIKIMIDSAINSVYRLNKEDSIRPNEKPNLFRRIYLLDEQEQPLNYLNDSLDKRFNYIDIFSKSALKVLKKGIRAWKIIPKLRGTSFSVGIIDYTITHKNHNYKFGKSASGKVLFELDCSTHLWKFKSMSFSDI